MQCKHLFTLRQRLAQKSDKQRSTFKIDATQRVKGHKTLLTKRDRGETRNAKTSLYAFVSIGPSPVTLRKIRVSLPSSFSFTRLQPLSLRGLIRRGPRARFIFEICIIVEGILSKIVNICLAGKCPGSPFLPIFLKARPSFFRVLHIII